MVAIIENRCTAIGVFKSNGSNDILHLRLPLEFAEPPVGGPKWNNQHHRRTGFASMDGLLNKLSNHIRNYSPIIGLDGIWDFR